MSGHAAASSALRPHRCRLSTQLARTEEAAKRALLKGDPSARGGTAQALLDAEREVQKLRAQVAELAGKLARWGACVFGGAVQNGRGQGQALEAARTACVCVVYVWGARVHLRTHWRSRCSAADSARAPPAPLNAAPHAQGEAGCHELAYNC